MSHRTRLPPTLLAYLVVIAAWLQWGEAPASSPKAGEFDRGDNAIWLRRHWMHEGPTQAEIAALVESLRARGIRRIYPFLGPMDRDGWPGWAVHALDRCCYEVRTWHIPDDFGGERIRQLSGVLRHYWQPSPHQLTAGLGASVFPEALEPIRCQLCVSHSVHDVLVAEVVLQGSRVPAVIGKLTGRANHSHAGTLALLLCRYSTHAVRGPTSGGLAWT